MYSNQNSLKVFISNNSYATSGSATSTLAELPVGEIGFYSEAGLLLPTGIGTGFFAYRKAEGQVIKSKTFTFAGWVAATKAYAAPTLEKQTVTISTATVGDFYQIRLEIKWPGMGGEYFKHGNYVAVTGDDTTAIAVALTASLNANLAREDKDYFTITSATNVITIETKLLPYVRGKKYGHPVWFKSGLIYPEDYAVLGVQTVAPSDGVGYGPYIMEKEFFAQGDSDALRFAGYPNSFDDRALTALSTGTYNVVPQTITDAVQTANADVRAPQEYLICFNDTGVTPAPIITDTTYAEGNITPAGYATPGSTVTVYIDGVATGTPVTANATTGAFTYGTTAVLETNVVTVRAVDGSAAASVDSNSVVVTA